MQKISSPLSRGRGLNDSMIAFVSLSQWWQSMAAAQQVFWFIAIVFTVLFFIQFVLSIIGFESHSSGFESHADTGGVDHEFSALSIRSIIAFFTFFGWTGVLVLRNGLGVPVAVTLASLAGMAAMFIVAYLMYKFSQLEESGSLNLYHALDQEGEVYLPIPGQNAGAGKVNLKVDGKVRELDAVTEGETLKTGTVIRVVEILENNVLKVELMPENHQRNLIT